MMRRNAMTDTIEPRNNEMQWFETEGSGSSQNRVAIFCKEYFVVPNFLVGASKSGAGF
jgi:hypothetical protein